jgi:hypothetical protein
MLHPVGLQHYEWLSFDYLLDDREQGADLPPGVEFVG